MIIRMKKALIEENIIGALYAGVELIISVMNYHCLYAPKNARI